MAEALRRPAGGWWLPARGFERKITAACGMLVAVDWDPEVTRLLQAECANRAFALAAARDLARSVTHPERRAFWVAFLALEEQSRERYGRVVASLGLRIRETPAVRARAWAAARAIRFATGPTMRGFLHSTRRYLRRLERLRELGPADARDFLDYVVTQEVAQVRALEHIAAGNWPAATGCIQMLVSDR